MALTLRGTHRLARLVLIAFLFWIGTLHGVALWRTWNMVDSMHERMAMSLQEKLTSTQRKTNAIETGMRGGAVEDERMLSIMTEERALAAESQEPMTNAQRVSALRFMEKQYETQLRSVPSTASLMWSLPRARTTTPIALSSVALAIAMLIVMWIARASRRVLVTAGAISVLLAAFYTVWLVAIWP